MTFEECVENLTPTEGVTLWRQIWNAAYRAGQEDMRERAAELCETAKGSALFVGACQVCAEEIRALEIKEGE